MRLKCECGVVLDVTISDGNNPGCKEREEIPCPECNTILYSQVHNDASVFIETIYNPNDQSLK